MVSPESLPNIARKPASSPSERSLMKIGVMVLCSFRISPRSSADLREAGLRFFFVAVADVVAGRIVVAAVYLLAGAVQVEGDGRPVSGVGAVGDAAVVGRGRGGAV